MRALATQRDLENAARDSGATSMGNAIRAAATNVAVRTNVAALTDRDAAEGFSATVHEFSAGQLAKAARRTKAAAKGWKDASRCPSAASLINMARSLPCVQGWLAVESGFADRAAQANSIDAVIRALYSIASGAGEEAMRARRIIALIDQPAEPVERTLNAPVRDLFERRRA